MKIFLPVLFLLAIIGLRGQGNLVPNPGFETYNPNRCPFWFTSNHFDFDTMVRDWKLPTKAHPDYFNGCAPFGNSMNVPYTILGYMPAHGGNAFVGLDLWLRAPAGNYSTDCHEYVQAKFTRPLEKDATYCVSFYVSSLRKDSIKLTDREYPWSSNATFDIGAAITATAPVQSGNYYGILPVTPQIQNPVNNYIMPADGWVKVSGIYKAAGNEQYITIGNFTPDSLVHLLPLNTVAVETKRAYVFLDDVSVVKMPNNIDTAACNNELQSLVLSVDSSDNGYLWSTGETQNSIMPGDTGWYWVEYKPGCPTRDSFYVFILPPPTVELPADSFVCTGASIGLKPLVSGGPAQNYAWSTGATTSTIAVANPGEYIVTVSNRCGAASDSILVEERSKPVVILPEEISLCVDGEHTPAVVRAPTLPSYLWSTGETTPEITIDKPGTYRLVSTNECGTDAQLFFAIDCPPDNYAVYIPNAFSPNGDGNNDVWQINSHDVQVQSIQVFNRWGEKVFEALHDKAWDGTYKGIAQPAGVYVYYVKCNELITNGPVQYRGSLTLIK